MVRLRIWLLLAALGSVAAVTTWTERAPDDPQPVHVTEAELAQRESLLDSLVTFKADQEPLGAVVDRIARDHRLPLARTRGRQEALWHEPLSITIHHPIQLRSALDLLGLEAGAIEQGSVWVGPARPLVLSAGDAASQTLLNQAADGHTRPRKGVAQVANRLFISIDAPEHFAELKGAVERVRATMNQQFAASESPDRAGRERLEAALRQPAGKARINLCLMDVSRTFEGGLAESREISQTRQTLAAWLVEFCALNGLEWNLEHEVIVLRPRGTFRTPCRVCVYALGASDSTGKAPLAWQDIERVISFQANWWVWLPASKGSPRGALVVATDAAQHGRFEKLFAALASAGAPALTPLPSRGWPAETTHQRAGWNLPVYRAAESDWDAMPFWLDKPYPYTLAGVDIGMGLVGKKPPPDMLCARLKQGGVWRTTELLAPFLMAGMADESVKLQPYASIQAVPGGLLLREGVHSPERMFEIWHTHASLQDTWLRWVHARPSRRGAVLAPAIAGDDALAAALAVCLLERRTMHQAQAELLLCLRCGTLQSGPGSAFAPLLWEAIEQLNVPPQRVADALTDMVARARRPLPAPAKEIVRRALNHPSPVVRRAALLTMVDTQPVSPFPVGWLEQAARDPQCLPAVRQAMAAYVERWRRTEQPDLQLETLLLTCITQPAAFDVLKEWITDDARRLWMEGRAMRPTLALYHELLRDSDPQVRATACNWLSAVRSPDLATRSAVTLLLADPLCEKDARYALTRWASWAEIRRAGVALPEAQERSEEAEQPSQP